MPGPFLQGTEKILTASIGLLQTANHGSVYSALFGKGICMFLFGQWVRFSRFRIMEKRYVSGSLVSASAIISVALKIQFRISANDMNIIRKAGSCRLCLPEYGPCPVPADEDNLYRFHTRRCLAKLSWNKENLLRKNHDCLYRNESWRFVRPVFTDAVCSGSSGIPAGMTVRFSRLPATGQVTGL